MATYLLSGIARVKFANIEIEANSIEEAIRKLDLELINDPKETLTKDEFFGGGMYEGSLLSELEVKLERATYKIKTTNISYDIGYSDINFDPYDTAFQTEEEQDEAELKADEQIQKLKESLPQELELEVEANEDDLDMYVEDAIYDKTGYMVNHSDYIIISQN